jgi:hypothetical protein
MKAQFSRNITNGAKYNQYFGNAFNGTIHKPKGTVYDTLDLMKKVIADTLDQTKKLAPVLRGKSLQETCSNVWHFVFNNIQYKLDQEGVEQIRTPNRTWSDRATGVDCDCYSVMISSILTNLGIPHFLRITEYDNKGYFQHVYVVVPKDGKTISGRSSYYVIDPVLNYNDYEKEFTKKHDRIMIPHQVLNGVGNAGTSKVKINFGSEFDHLTLLGLGSTRNLAPIKVAENVLDSIKTHINNTLATVKMNPSAVATVVDPKVFEKQLTYILENWNDPIAREAALEEMAEMEQLAESNSAMSGLGSLPNSVYGRGKSMATKDAIEKIELLRSRRKTMKNAIPATMRRGTMQRIPGLANLCNERAMAGLGNAGVGGLISKIKDKVQDVKAAVQNTAQNVKATVQQVAQKVGDVAQKVGTEILQNNPVTLALRAGVLAFLKLNLLSFGEKFYYSYYTPAQAAQYGLDIEEYNKLVAQRKRLEEAFTKMGGDPTNLRNATITGLAKNQVMYATLSGLGDPATATAAAAASGFFVTVGTWLKSVDFKKLLAKVKGAAEKAKLLQDSGLVDTGAAIKNALAKINPNAPIVDISANVNSDVVTKSGDVVNVTVDTASSFDSYTDTADYTKLAPSSSTPINDKPADPEKKSNTGMIVAGVSAVAIIGALALRGSGNAGTKPKKVNA